MNKKQRYRRAVRPLSLFLLVLGVLLIVSGAAPAASASLEFGDGAGGDALSSTAAQQFGTASASIVEDLQGDAATDFGGTADTTTSAANEFGSTDSEAVQVSGAAANDFGTGSDDTSTTDTVTGASAADSAASEFGSESDSGSSGSSSDTVDTTTSSNSLTGSAAADFGSGTSSASEEFGSGSSSASQDFGPQQDLTGSAAQDFGAGSSSAGEEFGNGSSSAGEEFGEQPDGDGVPQRSGLSIVVTPTNVRVGQNVTVEGELINVQDGNVTILLNGEIVSQVQANEDGTFEATFAPEEAGNFTVTVQANGVEASLPITVRPNVQITNIQAPDTVESGEQFEICADVASDGAAPTVQLVRDDTVVAEQTGTGTICFQDTLTTEGNETATATYVVRATMDGVQTSETFTIEVQPTPQETPGEEEPGGFITSTAAAVIALILVALAVVGYVMYRRGVGPEEVRQMVRTRRNRTGAVHFGHSTPGQRRQPRPSFRRGRRTPRGPL